MKTDTYAVIGDPIDHSLSPQMHNAAFAAAGIKASYEARRVPAGEIAFHLPYLRTLRGFNVTIPHKEAIIPFLDEIDAAAAEVGAVNTVRVNDGRLTGCNTDVAGFARTLEQVLNGAHVESAVVFGAGGSARAVLHTLRRRGVRIALVSRTVSRALALAESTGHGVSVYEAKDRALLRAISGADLIVNATPIGMSPADGAPLPSGSDLHSCAVVIDLVYGRTTELVALARRAGCRVSDGLEMLVQQGAEAFRLWTGVEPSHDVMRRACVAAIGETARC